MQHIDGSRRPLSHAPTSRFASRTCCLALGLLLATGCDDACRGQPILTQDVDAEVDAADAEVLELDAAMDTDASDASIDVDTGVCSGAACECQINADCGAHAECTPARTCACVVGYAKVDGACTWSSIVRNEEITVDEAWMVAGGATIEVAEMGLTTPGLARVPCTGGVLRQDVEVPELAFSEPLVVEVVSQGQNMLPDVAWDGRLTRVESESSLAFAPGRVCLGESAYGRTIALEVRGGRGACAAGGVLRVDAVRIVPAREGECPLPGVIPNPGFEEEDGWLTHMHEWGIPQIEEGVGQGGTRGASVRLVDPALTRASASFGTTLSWPEQSGTALAYWWSGTLSTNLHFTAERARDAVNTPAELIARAFPGYFPEGVLRRVCVPPQLRGRVTPFTFALMKQQGCGDCAGVVDDLAFVADPMCSSDPYVSDGGFEHSGFNTHAASWRRQFSGNGLIEYAFVGLQGIGRTGGAASLALDSSCTNASVETEVVVPRISQDGGPVIAIWAKHLRDTNTHLAVSIEGVANVPIDIGATTWRETRACLPPSLAGRVATVRVRARAVAASCTSITTFPMETMYLDDLSLGNDPSCPIE